ncbi:MAG: XylR family transcriptional regulator [Planctomycetota bacterium]|nr:XylR family transcriptional regulator [Planctomycetota bacterium]
MGQRWRVALLIQTSSDWHRQVLQGIANYAFERGGWDFFVEHRGLREPVSLPSWWQGDGVIGRLNQAELLWELTKRGLPKVNVSWLGEHSPSCPKVASDERVCGEMAAEHFLDKGFFNFAFLGPLPSLGYSDALKQSYVQTIQGRGFYCSVYVHGCPERRDLRAWLRDLPRPAALLVWDSEWGREALNQCAAASIRVPDDLAVLSVEHDSLMSVLAPIPISSIDQDPLRVGYEAAACLEDQMNGAGHPEAPRYFPPLRVSQRASSDTLATEDIVLAEALTFIRGNVTRPIQVQDVADACHVSRRVLEHRFGRTLGRSPAAEIRRGRLDIVKRLLRETDWSQREISRKAGFNYLEVMARAFRRSFGMTLGQYRSPFKMSVHGRSQGT